MEMDLEHIQFQLRLVRHLRDLQSGVSGDAVRMDVDLLITVNQPVSPSSLSLCSGRSDIRVCVACLTCLNQKGLNIV